MKQKKRKSGILLPVFSLASDYGIGCFSKEAYEFVDFLKEAGQKLWQILPLGPTGYGDSPYQSFSTFAGNPYFIDLEELIRQGYLTREECSSADFGRELSCIDYEKLYASRFTLLKKAFTRSREELEKQDAYLVFVDENAFWLEDYCLYMAVKDANQGVSFLEWEEGIRLRKPSSCEKYKLELREEIDFYRFQQFLFHVQWKKLKSYANENGIEIIGDIPIYVALDSADTWSAPELFHLDRECRPVAVAGCPPDAFAATGQLWGNPLYSWDVHQESGYEWWMRRIAYCFELYDILRIDHFRGFDAYWSVPYGDATAENGRWETGPGYDFFRVMKKVLGDRKVIAEDLGFLTKSVLKLVEKTGYPGMKVLQFAFDSREDSDYLPHNYNQNCVVYTGTHDNDTTAGWYDSITEHDREHADEYLNLHEKDTVQWEFIRAALSSVADTAVIPLQDYLGLKSEARINTPSTLGGNWEWRLEPDVLTRKLADQIRDITRLYGR